MYIGESYVHSVTMTLNDGEITYKDTGYYDYGLMISDYIILVVYFYRPK